MSIIIVMMSFFYSCSSTQKLQQKAPMNYGEVYCQKWAAGTTEGGSGINLFIPLSSELPKSVKLDSVYFRGKAAMLKPIERKNTLYVGHFITNFSKIPNVVMSIDSSEEYGNQAPILIEKIPFDLKDSECVVSYKVGNETKYFKIENIIEKQAQNYPSSPKGQ